MDEIADLQAKGLAGRFRFLARDSFVYGSINAVTKFIAIFLTPLLTRTLTTGEYGVMDALNPVTSIVATIIVMGMDSAVARFFYESESDEQKKKVISVGFFVQLFLGVVLSMSLFFIASPVSQFYLKTSSHAVELRIIAAVILLTTPLRFFQNLLRWIFQRKKFLIISIGNIVFIAAGTVVFVVWLDLGVAGVFIAQALAAAVFSTLGFIYCKKQLTLYFDRTLFSKMIMYGGPLMLVAFIPALVPSIDRYFINAYMGVAFVAYYGVAYRIASLLSLPIQSISTASGPFMYALYQQPDANKTFDFLAKGFCFILIVCAFGLIAFSDIISSLMAPAEYKQGLIALVPLVFALIFEAIAGIVGIGVDLSKKTYWNLVIHAGALLSTFAGMYLFGNTLGLFGIALAILSGKVIMFGLYAFFGYRSHVFRFSIFRILVANISGVAVAVLMQYILSDGFSWTSLGLLILTAITYSFASFFILFKTVERIKIFNVVSLRLSAYNLLFFKRSDRK